MPIGKQILLGLALSLIPFGYLVIQEQKEVYVQYRKALGKINYKVHTMQNPISIQNYEISLRQIELKYQNKWWY